MEPRGRLPTSRMRVVPVDDDTRGVVVRARDRVARDDVTAIRKRVVFRVDVSVN